MDDEQLRISHRTDGGRPGFAVNERHFPEKVPAFKERQNGFAAIDACHVDLHGPHGDQVQSLYRIVPFQDHSLITIVVLDDYQIGNHP